MEGPTLKEQLPRHLIKRELTSSYDKAEDHKSDQKSQVPLSVYTTRIGNWDRMVEKLKKLGLKR